MNLKRVLQIFEIIKNRLPSTYPRPKIVFYEDEKILLDHNEIELDKTQYLKAACDAAANIIMLPLTLSETYNSVDDVPLNKLTDDEIAVNLLHEIGHLYFAQRYGNISDEFFNEPECDKFAYRWLAKLKKDGLLPK